MARADPSLRQQLLDAQAKLERQIDILRAGPASVGTVGSFIDNSALIAELGETLRRINEALEELEPSDDPPGPG